MRHPFEIIEYTDAKEICLNFGKGDILIRYCVSPETNIPCVCFEVLKQRGNVGESYLDLSETDLYQKIDRNIPVVRLNFENLKSLDVLQGAIDLIRKKLQKENIEL